MSQDKFYFTKLAALPGRECLLCGHLAREQDAPSFTRLYLISGERWRFVADIQDVIYGLARGVAAPGLRPDLLAMGRDGICMSFSAGKPPVRSKVPTKDVSYLEAAANLFGTVYVCGGQNQVFRWDGSVVWTDLSQDIYEPFTGKLTASLEALAAHADDDLLFVGDRGAVYRLRARTWQRVELPTNVNLLSVFALECGKYLIGGVDGVLFELDEHDRVIDVSSELTKNTRISGFAVLGDYLYASASDKLLRIDKDLGIEEVSTPNDFSINSIAFIDAMDGYLWLSGGEQVLRFDGQDWDVLLCPDNR